MQHEFHFFFCWIVYWEFPTGDDQIGLFVSRYFKYTLGLLMVMYSKSKPDIKKLPFCFWTYCTLWLSLKSFDRSRCDRGGLTHVLPSQDSAFGLHVSAHTSLLVWSYVPAWRPAPSSINIPRIGIWLSLVHSTRDTLTMGSWIDSSLFCRRPSLPRFFLQLPLVIPASLSSCYTLQEFGETYISYCNHQLSLSRPLMDWWVYLEILRLHLTGCITSEATLKQNFTLIEEWMTNCM